MRRAREEQGFALVAGIVVMLVVLGLALALLSYGDVQQRAATRQSNSEQAFSLATAAMNAQIFELSSQWPTATANTQSPFPSSCGPANAGASFCPNPANSNGNGSFGNGYNPGGSAACPSTTPADPWGPGPVYNGWTTYVRDDGPGTTTQNLFNSTTDQSQPSYDSNNDNVVWVRSVGVVNCQKVTVLSRVSAQVVHLNFPQDAINANAFEVSNNGNQVFIDLLGWASQPSQISVRCNGLQQTRGPGSTCTNYNRTSQISPQVTWANPPGSATTLNASQLAAVKSQAIANGTYFSPNGGAPCPSSINQLTGSAVYVQGCGDLSYQGNGNANSAPNTSPGPGFLVLYDGTLDLSGTTNFYGLIYAVNSQGSTGDVVTLHGNACVTGGIDVDGNGMIQFGSSHNACNSPDNVGGNIAFDQTAFQRTNVSGGAQSSPNTFRVLPQGQ